MPPVDAGKPVGDMLRQAQRTILRALKDNLDHDHPAWADSVETLTQAHKICYELADQVKQEFEQDLTSQHELTFHSLHHERIEAINQRLMV